MIVYPIARLIRLTEKKKHKWKFNRVKSDWDYPDLIISYNTKTMRIVLTFEKTKDTNYRLIRFGRYKRYNADPSVLHCIYKPALAVYDFYRDTELHEEWYYEGRCITTEVYQWMQRNNFERPLSKSDQILLKLEFT